MVFRAWSLNVIPQDIDVKVFTPIFPTNLKIFFIIHSNDNLLP